MRVVAGGLKGRIIKAPEGRGTRPSTDRVRESMFSSLYSRVGEFDGLCVLDAFAGSGALGIEALSRGAASCVFFEVDVSAYATLKENIGALGLASRSTVVRGDVIEAVRLGHMPCPFAFDIVFLDPPYALESSAVVGFLESLAALRVLSDDAYIVYEHARSSADSIEAALSEADGYSLDVCKIYGKTGVTYVRRSPR